MTKQKCKLLTDKEWARRCAISSGVQRRRLAAAITKAIVTEANRVGWDGISWDRLEHTIMDTLKIQGW